MKKTAAFTAGYLQALVDIAYGEDMVNGTFEKRAAELKKLAAATRPRPRLKKCAAK